MMSALSPQMVYDNLNLLERVDISQSALYRQQAVELLADSGVSLSWRQAIADRLHNANRLLTLLSANTDEDSY
jgi:hypothetical protein